MMFFFNGETDENPLGSDGLSHNLQNNPQIVWCDSDVVRPTSFVTMFIEIELV